MKQISLLLPLLFLFSCSITDSVLEQRLPAPVPMVEQSLSSLDEPLDYFGYPIYPGKDEVLALVEKRDVQTMDSLLKKYDLLSRNDYRYEYHVSKMLNFFADADDAKAFLVEWQLALPNSPYLTLAYAKFHIAEGWRARGEGFANTVSRENWQILRDNLETAAGYLDDLAQRDPEILYQWNCRLTIAHTIGKNSEVLEAINRSLAINPYQALIREQYQDDLRPRWGGTMQLMNRFAKRCDSLAQFNPRLLGIRAMIYNEKARTHYEHGDTAEAMKAYEAELEINPTDFNKNWWVCKYYWGTKEYERALKYSGNLVTIFPEGIKKAFYGSHAKLLYLHAREGRNSMSEDDNNALIEEMVRYNEKALRYKPDDEWALKNKRWYDQFMRNGKVVM